MSPERVSVGEEWEGHSMLMDRRQKRRGNQQWRVWCEQSGGSEYQKRSGQYGRVCKVEDSYIDKLFCQLTVENSAFLRSRESQGQQYKENDGKLHGDVTLVDDGEPADTDTVRHFRFHSSMAAAATCCRFLQRTLRDENRLAAKNEHFVVTCLLSQLRRWD